MIYFDTVVDSQRNCLEQKSTLGLLSINIKHNMHESELLNEFDHFNMSSLTGFWGRSAAGSILVSKSTGRFCLAHRSSEVNEPNTWGLWGGAMNGQELPEVAARRELVEEAGFKGDLTLIPLSLFQHPSGFRYYNFIALVDKEFAPKIDWETQGFRWFSPHNPLSWPQPLHPGLGALLANQDVFTFLFQVRSSV
jgi:8-oxo-dGTP pyrophosphatase MutT (NUDIX family)